MLKNLSEKISGIQTLESSNKGKKGASKKVTSWNDVKWRVNRIPSGINGGNIRDGIRGIHHMIHNLTPRSWRRYK